VAKQTAAEVLLFTETQEVCDATTEESAIGPQLIFFISNMIAATGSTLFSTLGVTYLDDNVRKEKAPLILSITNFMRMLGTPIGFAAASYCLKIYVASTMHPSIPNTDPRWIGAWWMGWFGLSAIAAVGALLLGKYFGAFELWNVLGFFSIFPKNTAKSRQASLGATKCVNNRDSQT
jgi:Organic Anion Transporter Polypeptide (OATP) family